MLTVELKKSNFETAKEELKKLGVFVGMSARKEGQMNIFSVSERVKNEGMKNADDFLRRELGDSYNNKKVFYRKHSHGNDIELIESNSIGYGESCRDGLMARNNNKVILTARCCDCLPLYLFEPCSRTTGIVHCSWKTIVDKIIFDALDIFETLDIDFSKTIAVTGPGICQKCFVVKEDVADCFRKYKSYIFSKTKGEYHVDLKGIINSQLRNKSVKVFISDDCTYCDPDRKFFSYRRDGFKNNQLAYITLI